MGEETDNLASSTSKLREQIKSLTGVDIMLDDNTYKSTAAIIQEIGAQWDKLSDVSQAAALEILAGKTRASTVAGLLENYETIGEVIEAAENADGSAIEENARYLESVAGKLSQFQNKAQEFWHTVLDTEVVKDIIDFGTKLLDIAGKFLGFLEDIGGLLPSLTGIGGVIFKNSDLGQSFTDIFKNVGRDKMLSLNHIVTYINI